MLKTGCVFDLQEIQDFHDACGVDAGISNSSMFFYLAEDGEYFGMIRMDIAGDDCQICDAVVKNPNVAYEEFLLKSCVNFALTFSAKQLITTTKYATFLLPMHFAKVGDTLVGKVEEIDFPHPCCNSK